MLRLKMFFTFHYPIIFVHVLGGLGRECKYIIRFSISSPMNVEQVFKDFSLSSVCYSGKMVYPPPPMKVIEPTKAVTQHFL